MSPIPLGLVILVVRSSERPADLITMLVKRINNLRNPGFLNLEGPDPRFARLVRLLDAFTEAGLIHWVKDPADEKGFSVVIRNYAPEYADAVREFLDLLELPSPAEEAEDIVLSIKFALKSTKGVDIAIETRSTMDLIEILRASVEVPEEHAEKGYAVPYPPTGFVGKKIRIRRAENRPRTASVAVNYSGYWFYIDRRDQRTKKTFGTLRTLLDIIIARTAEQQPIPVLTVPVSR
jgi:hypothetical protein